MNTPSRRASVRATRLHSLLVALPLFAVASLPAAEISRTNTSTALNLGTSWVGGNVPGAGDIAVWDSTITTGRNNVIGGNLSFGGIKVTNPTGDQGINASTGSTLTLGASGIDMSNATANFTISAIMDLSASQTWTVASGRTLTLSGLNTGSGTITLSGAGGTFAIGTNSNGSAAAATTAGPLGTGTVNLENGIRLSSSTLATSRVIRNAVNLNGDIEIFMGNSAGGSTGISLSGGMNIGSANRTITLTNPDGSLTAPTLTFGGNGGFTTVSGSGRLTFENGNTGDAPMVYVRSASGTPNDFALFETDVTIGNGVTFIAGANGVFTASSDLIINAGGVLNTSNNGGVGSVQTIGSLSGAGTVFTNSSNAAIPTLTIDGGERTIRTVFSGALQNGPVGSLGVTKQGSSTQVFSGTNTYIGKTTVTGGGLYLDGTHIQSSAVTGNGYGNIGTGHYQVGTGAVFGGSGRISGNTASNNSNMVLVQSGGILAPGGDTALGALTLDGGNIGGLNTRVLNMASGAKFDFTLSGNSSTSDQIVFWNFTTGDLLLNSNTVDISLTGPQVGGTYVVNLFEFFSDSGSTAVSGGIVSGLVLGTLGEGIESASISYNGSSIDLTYTVATQVPEPASAALLLGLAGLLCGVTRRRRRA